MKKRILFAACFMVSISAMAQRSFQQILSVIEQNNLDLAAMKYNVKAQKLEWATQNNLQDPEAEYIYQFSSPSNVGNETEFVLTQGFDFPTAYAARGKYRKLQEVALSRNEQEVVQEVKLRAIYYCLEMIGLNQQDHLWKEHAENLRSMVQQYESKLQRGDANALELNKIKMDLMEADSKVRQNDASYRTALQGLIALNGGKAITFDQSTYPSLPVQLNDVNALVDDYRNSDAAFLRLKDNEAVAAQQVKVMQAEGLPKLQVGYRRNTAQGERLNGFVVGTSIPLFSNRGRVKAAKAQQLCNDLQTKREQTQAEAYIVSLFNKRQQLSTALSGYDANVLVEQEGLLRKGLDLGQYSIIEYLTEMSQLLAVQQTFVELEKEYQQVCYELLRYRL